MRFLFDNAFLDASVTATNASDNYPVQNLQSKFLQKRFQSTGTSSVITFEWTVAVEANCFFYAHHNLTAITAVYKDSLGATLATVTPSSILDVGVVYFNQLSDVRSVEITITGPDPVWIGGVATGVYVQLANPLADFGRPLKDNTYLSAIASGQVLSNYEKPLRSHSWTLRDLTVEDANVLRHVYIRIGKGRTFWADFFEGARELAEPLYCYFTGEPGDQKNGRRIDYTISVMEAR